MLYRVQANFIEERREEFLRILTDGTVSSQKPEGQEIVASMRRAVRRDSRVEWAETCYCSPPLAHERATVYDRFFTDIKTEPIESNTPLQGESFWEYLESGRTGEGG
jgi:hypothetical protein